MQQKLAIAAHACMVQF